MAVLATDTRPAPPRGSSFDHYGETIREIGTRLRAARLAAGLSQETVAAALGITFQQWQKYEKGTNRISAAQLVRAAAVLRCARSDLLPAEADGPGGLADPLSEAADLIAVAGRPAVPLLQAVARLDPADRQKLVWIAGAMVDAARWRERNPQSEPDGEPV